MLSLTPEKLQKIEIPLNTSWLLGACMEAKGKQDLWLQKKPEVLETLKEQAMVQSAESSNRIEGVTVSNKRLRPLVLKKSRPRDRSEEELAGYRRALDWIFSRKKQAIIVPEVIKRLHALAQGGLIGDEVPKTVELLCQNYELACNQPNTPPLLIIANFVFDLLCIHPFRDGNGRVSRLVTTLLLQMHGFEVARYISLERLVEERKEEYYNVLEQCSQGWHEGKNENVPWWNYFLSVLRSAYQELAHQLETLGAHSAKGELVRKTILSQLEPFSLADLSAKLPTLSVALIKKVLAELKQKQKIQLAGKGRGALWTLLPKK